MEDTHKIAKMIKEKYSYVVPDGDLLKELSNFDRRINDEKLRKKYDKYIEGIFPIKN